MKHCKHIMSDTAINLDTHGRYAWPDGEDAGMMCNSCAVEVGFCPACGEFVGGIGADMPYMQEYGMCHDCYQFSENGEVYFDEDT